jgi:hypothetical protein
MIDLDAARRYLTATLDGEIEIEDEEVLNDAAVVVAVSPQSEGPRSPLRGPSATTARRNSRDEAYPQPQTRAI